jgi:hypothetical protein
MTNLRAKIDRIIADAGGCLTAVEITLRLNAEIGGSLDKYTISEVVACADSMSNLHRFGKEYCQKEMQL